jgi:hypothetical protein
MISMISYLCALAIRQVLSIKEEKSKNIERENKQIWAENHQLNLGFLVQKMLINFIGLFYTFHLHWIRSLKIHLIKLKAY